MPLAPGYKPGDRLGAYEIVALLGKGGMGEVWKAHDTQLGRDVAIKVSAQQFTDRFDREARAIASLNHPNVCTLYHIGPNYLVMELIEGPTLADRIHEGPIPLKEALSIAKQIAAALEAAHDKDIVHRDLKPANVKIKPDGSAKVLDFGLAKSAEHAEVSADSPTMMSGTQIGMILGTAGYMAPEQARGKKDVDKRADIWAFGVVLYEMLTGKRLFQGEDVTHTLAAVIMQEPDLSAAPAEVLPLLKRCLEKDPKNRLRDIGDWELLLQVGQAFGLPEQANGLPHHRPWIAVAAILAVVAAALGFGLYRATRPAPLKPLIRLDVDLGADVALPPASSGAGAVVLSPDGARLVYQSGHPVKLFIRRLDQPKATELQGTEGAIGPFFSPDGQWVGFTVGRKLSKISVEGGAVVPLLDVPDAAGASWGEDGSILIGAQLKGGIMRISASGGSPETLAKLADGELALFSPQLLPGGKAVLFSAYPAPTADSVTIEVLTLADRRRKVVLGVA
jgi:predicted Ser/Thr protein kinase